MRFLCPFPVNTERFIAVLLALGFVQNGLVNGFSSLQSMKQHRCSTSATTLHSVPTFIDTLTSGLASICRLSGGVKVSEEASFIPEGDRPVLLRYYWIENNVDCRRVSERITELDLSVDAVIPASPNARAMTDLSSNYAMGSLGVAAPTLVVEEKGVKRAFEGVDDILNLFNDRYGVKREEADESNENTKEMAINFANTVGNFAATALRFGRGMEVSKAAGPLAPRPRKPLVLYDYTGNQFSRLVREVLMELDLVFEMRSVGKGSPRRQLMSYKTEDGSTQCPYLIDPNTNVSMKGSKAIIEYLYTTYAVYTPPSEVLEWASETVLSLAQPVLSVLAKVQAGSRGKDKSVFEASIYKASEEIKKETSSAPVVVYTYEWSPFSWETKSLLERSGVAFKEISLGNEWFPGAIAEGGSEKRAALLNMTGQSSLPHIFVGGESIGGLFSGTPGLVPSLAEGKFMDMVAVASRATSTFTVAALQEEAAPFS